MRNLDLTAGRGRHDDPRHGQPAHAGLDRQPARDPGDRTRAEGQPHHRQCSRFPHATSVIPEIRRVFDPRRRSPPAGWLRWAIMSNRYAPAAAAILFSLTVSACGQSGQPASGPGAPSASPTPAPAATPAAEGRKSRGHGQRSDEVLRGRDSRQGGRAPERDARQPGHDPKVLDGAQLGAPSASPPTSRPSSSPRPKPRRPNTCRLRGRPTFSPPRSSSGLASATPRRSPPRPRPAAIRSSVRSPATPRSACVAC